MDNIVVNVTQNVDEVAVNVTQNTDIVNIDVSGTRGPPGVASVYFGTGEPPDPTGLPDGTLFFKYI